jgi:hypothetical protein
VRIEFANLVEKLIIRVLQVSGVRFVCHANDKLPRPPTDYVAQPAHPPLHSPQPNLHLLHRRQLSRFVLPFK